MKLNLNLDVKFTCPSCKSSFTLKIPFIYRKKEVTCPNCEEPFPKEKLDLLNEGIDRLNKFSTSDSKEWEIYIS